MTIRNYNYIKIVKYKIFSNIKKIKPAQPFIVEQDSVHHGLLQCTHNFVLHNCKGRAKGLFEIVVAVAVQRVFCLEIHQNNVFLFFKNYF
jgi:hypothetical protein